METPLERAQAKCEQLERKLKRSPDFQLYLLTKSLRDRARMENLLMEIPQFALWRKLARSVESVDLLFAAENCCPRAVSAQGFDANLGKVI